MDLSERPSQASRRHPWEVSRARFFRRVLGADRPTPPRRVLDVGAGDAWFSSELLRDLGPDARAVCWDVGYTPSVVESLARDADPRLSFSARHPEGRFDLLLLLDVLEHVEDDRGLLDRLLRENLGPGATVLVSVPAWPRLFSAHDTALRHLRRYTPRQGAALLTGAGLRIERHGGLFHSLLLPRLATRVGETLRPPRAVKEANLDWRHGAVLTRAVEWALALDNAVSLGASRARAELPGLSWWALCTVGSARG